MSGYRSPDSPALWIRDHSDILRAGKFFYANVKSAVEAFAETQSRSGRVFDYVLNKPASSGAGDRENWEKWVRIQVEADVEYRFVKAAFIAWQATGDDAWMKQMLPSLERALLYTTTHPLRHDPETGLVKRAYTMDTWDFDYTAGRYPWLNFQITEDTFWGIMHGDNSGTFEAAGMLARMHDVAGQPDRAEFWRAKADAIAEASNRLLFNGRFYTHHYKLTDVVVEGVDVDEQLSLSNPMAITRGMATPEIAKAILTEYQDRRKRGDSFAEWFSIDPPFPTGFFGDEKLIAGAYINGGIMPLVGGELSLAAFRTGFEQYGLQTLDQYRELIESTGETYLWYFPDGTPSSVDTSTSPEAMPTDGWGSSSMLNAFVEGLCGIVDKATGFTEVEIAPRWLVSDEHSADVELSYAASGATLGYQYRHDAGNSSVSLTVDASAPQMTATFKVLVPHGRQPDAMSIDNSRTEFEVEQQGESVYAVASVRVNGQCAINLTYR